MTYMHLISTAELAGRLQDPAWVVVDCRFDLANPDWGRSDYEAGHIPGAVYSDLNRDLSAPVTSNSGRHPLPTLDEFRRMASRLGIDAGKQVVVYDTSGGTYAARLWWLLKFYGHEAVALLDGGWKKWQQENRPVANGVESNPPTRFTGEPRMEMVAEAEEVERIREDPAYRLIDARAPERYRGEIEPIDSVAGHIPGAINRFHGDNLTGDGIFKSPDVLRKEYYGLLQGINPAHVVVYCGSGVTSIHDLLAMELAGLPGGKLYVGSWSEWIRDPGRPRATGPQ